MKGLIIKDFLNIYKSSKIVGVVIVFYAIMAFTMENPSSFLSLFILLLALYFLSTFSFDELAKWDTYALTMPLSRDNIVQAKYLAMILFSISGFVISSILLIVLNFITKQNNIFDGIKYNALCIGGVIIFYAILIPFIVKFGAVKARIYLVIMYMVLFLLGSFVFKRIKEIYTDPPKKLIAFAEMIINNLYIIVPLVLVAALGISYITSVHIYRKKEF